MSELRWSAPAVVSALLASVTPADAQTVAAAAEASPLVVCGSLTAAAEDVVAACDAALSLQEIVSDLSATAAVYVNLGVALAELGAHEKARDAYEAALRRDGSLGAAWMNRGRSLLRLGEPALARKSFEQALALDPADRSARIGRGAAWLALDTPERAISDFDLAHAMDPDEPSALYNRARAHLAIGDRLAAVSDLAAVTALDPRDVEAQLALGRLLLEKNPDGAIARFSAAVAAAPEDAALYVARADALEAVGRAEEALVDYRRAWDFGLRTEALLEKIRDR